MKNPRAIVQPLCKRFVFVFAKRPPLIQVTPGHRNRKTKKQNSDGIIEVWSGCFVRRPVVPLAVAAVFCCPLVSPFGKQANKKRKGDHQSRRNSSA